MPELVFSVVPGYVPMNQLVRPLLRHVERRIEQREVEWGHRTVLVYMHRVGDSSRPFTTLSGIW